MSAVGTAVSWIKNVFIYKSVPFLVAFGIYSLGTPWYVPILVLLFAPHWYGPILIYYQQRMPTISPLQPIADGNERPPAHNAFFSKMIPLLQGAGFIYLGRLSCDDKKQLITTTASVLQHPETSDIAHVMIATKEGYAGTGETVVFSRVRSDGSRIFTTRNTIQSPFPPNPRDSTLRVDRSIDLLDLWSVHRVRVAHDTSTKRNDCITDALRFQTVWEREGNRSRIDSGMWQRDERPAFLRPTARGALLMCLRMLPPWRQLSRLRARMQLRRLLREVRGQ